MKVSEFEKKLQEAEFHEALGHLREITKIKDLIPFASNLEISCLMNQRLSNTEIIEFLSAVTPPPPPPVQVVAPPVVAPPAVAPPAVAPPAVAPSAVAQPVPNQTIQTLPPGFGESGGGWFFYQPPQSQAQSQSVPRNNSYNNQYNQKWPTVRGSMQRKYSRGNSRNADNNY